MKQLAAELTETLINGVNWLFRELLKDEIKAGLTFSIALLGVSAIPEWRFHLLCIELVALVVLVCVVAFRYSKDCEKRSKRNAEESVELPGFELPKITNQASTVRAAIRFGRNDRFTRGTFFVSAGFVILYSVAAQAFYLPTVKVCIGDHGMGNGNPIQVVILQGGRTVGTGWSNEDGVVQLRCDLAHGELKLIAERKVEGWRQWSEEKGTYVGNSLSLDMPNFPQHEHEASNLPVLYFQRGKESLLNESGSALGQIDQELHALDGYLLLKGRTCDQPFSLFSTENNMSLSIKRCETVVDRLVPPMLRGQVIAVPLADEQPFQTLSHPSEESRARERSVEIVPLKRTGKDRAIPR